MVRVGPSLGSILPCDDPNLLWGQYILGLAIGEVYYETVQPTSGVTSIKEPIARHMLGWEKY